MISNEIHIMDATHLMFPFLFVIVTSFNNTHFEPSKVTETMIVHTT
jgi:hypothetical protein